MTFKEICAVLGKERIPYGIVRVYGIELAYINSELYVSISLPTNLQPDVDPDGITLLKFLDDGEWEWWHPVRLSDGEFLELIEHGNLC